MQYTGIFLALTATAILLALIAIFIGRKQYRNFPFFFAYIVFSVIAALLRYIVIGHPVIYFIVYWAAEAIYAALALLVIREVFHRTFTVAYDLYSWTRFLLPVTVVIILGFSIYEGIHHAAGYGRILFLTQMIYWFDLGVHAFQAALLLLLLSMRLIFPVQWLRYEFGILAGFGCNAVFIMTADLLRFDFGSSYESFFRYGPPLGYILATVIWLQAFYAPPEQVNSTLNDPQELLELIHQHAGLLDRIKEWLRHKRLMAVPR